MGVDNSTTSDIGNHLELFRSSRLWAICFVAISAIQSLKLLFDPSLSLLLLLQPELPQTGFPRSNLLRKHIL